MTTLQRLDYIRVPYLNGFAEGTVHTVYPDGSLVAWMDYSVGQLVVIPPERAEHATLLARNGRLAPY